MSGPGKPKDVRWIQRFDNFKRALAQLARAAALAKERDLSNWKNRALFTRLNSPTNLPGRH